MTPEKFESMCIPEPNTGCWLWLGSVNRKNYGRVTAFGKTRFAHRVSYQLYRGEDPGSLMTCHRCDNPSCVNPDHLFLGTAIDNNADMTRKGRRAIGTRNGQTRMTPEQAAEAKWSPDHPKVVARRLGVEVTTVWRARRGMTWRHLAAMGSTKR